MNYDQHFLAPLKYSIDVAISSHMTQNNGQLRIILSFLQAMEEILGCKILLPILITLIEWWVFLSCVSEAMDLFEINFNYAIIRPYSILRLLYYSYSARLDLLESNLCHNSTRPLCQMMQDILGRLLSSSINNNLPPLLYSSSLHLIVPMNVIIAESGINVCHF